MADELNTAVRDFQGSSARVAALKNEIEEHTNALQRLKAKLATEEAVLAGHKVNLKGVLKNV